MSNASSRGGGGSRRDVPESAVQDKLAQIRARRAERQANRAAGLLGEDDPQGQAGGYEEEDSGEATQAFNVADFDLDEPAPAPAPARGRAPAAAADEDDDESEKTAAFSVDSLGDLLAEPAAPAPKAAAAAPARPAPGRAPARPEPARAPARPEPARPAARPEPPPRQAPPRAAAEDEDDGEGKTQAFSLDSIGSLLEEPVKAPAPAPAARAGRAAPAPAPAPARHDDDDDDGEGRTQAFSLDDFGAAPAAPGRRPGAPAAAADDEDGFERTMAVSLDEIPAPSADRTMMVDVEADIASVKADIERSRGGRGKGKGAEPAKAARAPEPAKPAYLTVLIGTDLGKTYTLERDTSLFGRGMDADCVISDASASRKHFNVVRAGAGWKLVDLGSGNGTKVDGTKVKELVLKDGMKIECGTTTLEFHDPAAKAGRGKDASGGAAAMREVESDDDSEKTRMGDMAALEIDPDWEARRARARLEAAQGQETIAQPVPEEIAPPKKKKGGAGKVAAIVGGLVLLGGGGFVAADKFAGLGIIFPKEVPAETTSGGAGGTEPKPAGAETGAPAGSEAGVEDEAAKVKKAKGLVTDGEAAYVEQRWYEAKKLFKEALALNPKAERDNGVPVDEAVLLVDAQIDAQQQLVDAKKAISEERFAEALDLLKKIKVESAYHKDAQELVPGVRDDFVAQSLGVARQFEEKGDLEAAKKAVAEALTVAKEDPDALAMQVALERAAAPDADNLETDDEDPAKRVQDEKVAKADLAPGFAKYGAGEFMGAIDFFDGITYGRASRRDKAKAKAVAGAITKFDTVLRAGRDALTAGNGESALENLRQAKKYDQAVNGSFQAQLNQDIGKAYAMLAKGAYDQKQLAQAGAWAKKALGVDPANADAKAMMTDVLKTAYTWVEDAKAAAGENPDKAMALLTKALNVLPVEDAAYKTAYALLNDLAAKMEE